jgi:hypothetical protein
MSPPKVEAKLMSMLHRPGVPIVPVALCAQVMISPPFRACACGEMAAPRRIAGRIQAPAPPATGAQSRALPAFLAVVITVEGPTSALSWPVPD